MFNIAVLYHIVFTSGFLPLSLFPLTCEDRYFFQNDNLFWAPKDYFLEWIICSIIRLFHFVLFPVRIIRFCAYSGVMSWKEHKKATTQRD